MKAQLQIRWVTLRTGKLLSHTVGRSAFLRLLAVLKPMGLMLISCCDYCDNAFFLVPG